jgi:hypothetical protein
LIAHARVLLRPLVQEVGQAEADGAPKRTKSWKEDQTEQQGGQQPSVQVRRVGLRQRTLQPLIRGTISDLSQRAYARRP